MSKVSYRTIVTGDTTGINVNVELETEEEALDQARLLSKNNVVAKVMEIKTDGEDIISSRMIYDGSDE